MSTLRPLTTLERLNGIVCGQTGIHPQAITPATRLGDIGDNLDLLGIVCECEQVFHIDIDEQDLETVGTVGELVELIDVKRTAEAA